jgi:multidrug efflux pump subunit AcrB
MSLPSLSIKKPVLAGVFSALIVIMGIVGWKYLGVREFPLTEPPPIRGSVIFQAVCRSSRLPNPMTRKPF